MPAVFDAVAETLAAQPALLYIAAGLFGLVIGSFLNVVILRLPRMMEQEWRASAADILGQPATAEPATPLSLSQPASHCPHCQRRLRVIDNIPLLSYLWLRGRCAGCGAPISAQYPLVEAASALLSVLVAARFGATPFTLLALVFTWALLAAAVIDWNTQLLPDGLTLPLLWLGLIVSLGPVAAWSQVTPAAAIVGAAAGYLLLWSIYHGFRLATGKHGMGYGDFKLLAALGAWLGWQMLPLVLFLASLAGALVGGLLMATGVLGRGKPMPFGPWLAAAGWLALVAGDTISRAYSSVAGLS